MDFISRILVIGPSLYIYIYVCSQRKGAHALNHAVKTILAEEAIFTLARKGEAELVRAALVLNARPDEGDYHIVVYRGHF